MMTTFKLTAGSRVGLGGAFALACLAGSAIPLYMGMVGNAWVALAALPVALALLGMIALDRKSMLLFILLTRAACDLLLESARPDLGGEALGLGAVINALVIGLAVMLVIGDPKAVPRPALMLWLGFFLTTLYGLALSPVRGEAVRVVLGWLSNFAVFVSAFHVVRNRDDFRSCVRLIVWSSVAPALYGLYILVGSAGLVSNTLRLRSTFGHPNIFAFYLTLVIPLGFYLLKSRTASTGRWRQAGLALYLGLLLMLVVFTQTRSAWLALVILCAGYGLLFERRYLLYLGLLAGVAAGLPAVHERLLDLAGGGDAARLGQMNSFAWRVALWSAALDWMAPQRYLFGYGIGAFRDNAATFFPLGGAIRWDAHNVYVQWFFDAGLVGLAAYLWLHGRLIGLLRPLLRTDRLAAFVLISAVLGYLIVALSDNMMFYLAFNWYFYFAVGIGIACARLAYTGQVQPDHGVSGAAPGPVRPVRTRAAATARVWKSTRRLHRP